jgi:hypothetical protein
VDNDTEMNEAFDKHIKGHIASQYALLGASSSHHRDMILSAIRGTWMYAYKKGQEDIASPVATPDEPQVVRYMQPIAVTESQAALCRRSELYKLGDAVLVWVNEGDLLRCGQKLPEPVARKTTP